MANTNPFEVDVANGQSAIIGRTTGLNNAGAGATAVSGEGSGPSDGVNGSSDSGTGVTGYSDSGTGISGTSTHGHGVTGFSTEQSGVSGTSLVGAGGLLGGTDPVFAQHVGAYGESDQQGVMGIATTNAGTGVYGGGNVANKQFNGIGVRGETFAGTAIHGQSFGPGASFGLLAGADPEFAQHVGAYGESDQQGVMGLATSNGGTGVYGGGHVADKQFNGVGVRGETFNGTGIQGQSFGTTGAAGRFMGNVFVTGDLHLGGALDMGGADYAEDFDTVGRAAVEPGTVVVLDDSGGIRPSDKAYDRRVAGVVSGANGYQPGVILDRQTDEPGRSPVALMGKVYCKVDASNAPISVGDLLTSSVTAGYAMKAVDPARAFGAVIGKALCSLRAGRGLVPILVGLQ